MSVQYARSLQRVVELLGSSSPLLARERGMWDAAAQGGRALARRRAHAQSETAERVHISDACAKVRNSATLELACSASSLTLVPGVPLSGFAS